MDWTVASFHQSGDLRYYAALGPLSTSIGYAPASLGSLTPQLTAYEPRAARARTWQMRNAACGEHGDGPARESVRRVSLDLAAAAGAALAVAHINCAAATGTQGPKVLRFHFNCFFFIFVHLRIEISC